MSRSEMVVNKRMSFGASVVWGLCSVIIVTVVCASGIVFYGMRLIDQRGGSVIDLVERQIANLPATIEAVPVLQDVVHNQRRLDYADNLEVAIEFDDHPYRKNYLQTVVTVANRGTELVAMMGMRVVVSDDRGRIIMTDSEYLATPVMLNRDLPGPLAPGSTRRMTLGSFRRVNAPQAEFEIPELRVWDAGARGAAARLPQAKLGLAGLDN